MSPGVKLTFLLNQSLTLLYFQGFFLLRIFEALRCAIQDHWSSSFPFLLDLPLQSNSSQFRVSYFNLNTPKRQPLNHDKTRHVKYVRLANAPSKYPNQDSIRPVCEGFHCLCDKGLIFVHVPDCTVKV